MIRDYTRNIRERKGSSVQGREESLARYVDLLKRRFCGLELEPEAAELMAAFLRCVRNEDSELETVAALKGT
jgi:hypothetical protein